MAAEELTGVWWTWNPGFGKLIQAISSKQILALSLPDHLFVIGTDASAYQAGASLVQVFPDGEQKPAHFLFHSLNSHKKNYSVPEKECLAAV